MCREQRARGIIPFRMAASSQGAARKPAPVEIGRFRPPHLARVLEIERAAFPEGPYSRKIFLSLYSECGELFLVAKVSRRVAGYMATCVHPRMAEVVSVAVDPEHRRSGVGTALLAHTIELLKSHAVRLIELMVRADNREALRFYRRFGFRRVEEVPAYYENDRAGLRMRRVLIRGRARAKLVPGRR